MKRKTSLFILPPLGVCLMVVLLSLICNSCSKSSTEVQKFNAAERQDLEKFFRYIFLKESAIFTLAGTKPLTLITVVFEKENGDR